MISIVVTIVTTMTILPALLGWRQRPVAISGAIKLRRRKRAVGARREDAQKVGIGQGRQADPGPDGIAGLGWLVSRLLSRLQGR